jgi:hypothetical protein
MYRYQYQETAYLASQTQKCKWDILSIIHVDIPSLSESLTRALDHVTCIRPGLHRVKVRLPFSRRNFEASECNRSRTAHAWSQGATGRGFRGFT